MVASPGTRRKLAGLSGELQREFPEAPVEQVDGLVRAVADDLLERARFDDFVPLLAHRLVREQLLDHPYP